MRRFVLCKNNCEREYENGDRKPDPSPDILLNGDSHRLTLTVPKTIECCRMRKRANSSGVVLRILMGADAIATMTLTSGRWNVTIVYLRQVPHQLAVRLLECDFLCELIGKVDLAARCTELLSNRNTLSASKSACVSIESTRQGEWTRLKMAISALRTLPSISCGSRS